MIALGKNPYTLGGVDSMLLSQSIAKICKFCGPECKVGYSICHCGTRCGMVTNKDKNGRHNKYVYGHQNLPHVELEDAIPFKIDGEPCRLIKLTKGQYAIVDADNYERLAKYKWSAMYCQDTGLHYATRHGRVIDGTAGEQFSMHRVVMGIGKGDERRVDHINSIATLDNRRSNLRFATVGQNAQNSKLPRTNRSGFRGVSWSTQDRKWKAFISVNNKTRYIGAFVNPVDAAHARDRVARSVYGEFARLNFPDVV